MFFPCETDGQRPLPSLRKVNPLEQIAAVENERNSLLIAHEEPAVETPARAAMLRGDHRDRKNFTSGAPITNEQIAGKLNFRVMADFPGSFNGLAHLKAGRKGLFITVLSGSVNGSDNGIVVPTDSPIPSIHFARHAAPGCEGAGMGCDERRPGHHPGAGGRGRGTFRVPDRCLRQNK